MSLRAVIIGLIGAVFIAAAGYINDYVLHLAYLVGCHLPVSVFGLLLLIILVINPILYMVHKGFRLRSAELGVIVALMLVACSIPTSGLMRTWTVGITMPIQYNRNLSDWKKFNLLDYTAALMPAGGKDDVPGMPDDQAVMKNFLSHNVQGQMFGWKSVPWSQWQGPILAWAPLLLLLAVSVICLSLVLHRQWASRERLRYPLAEFATRLVSQDPHRAFGPIVRSKLFWIGLGVVVLIRILGGLKVWYPDAVEIPMTFDFTANFNERWSDFVAKGGWSVTKFTLYPTVIAFGFLLASEVGLSLGISQMAFVMLQAAMLTAGVVMDTDYLTGGLPYWQLFGSYLGAAVLVLYIGRRYYWDVLKQAFTFRRHEGVESHAAWAMRIGMLSAASLVALLTGLGMGPAFATMFVLLTLLTFMVIARINAESGLFFVQAYWTPAAVLVGLFGGYALGPKAMMLLFMMSSLLVMDPRECLMPFVMNGLKMTDNLGVKPARVGFAGAWVYALCLGVAIPVVLAINYGTNEPAQDDWAYNRVAKMPFDAGVREVTKLAGSEQLEQSKGLGELARLSSIHPDKRFLWAAGVGVVLALSFSLLRLRFSWWPLHPIIFLVWGTWPMVNLAPSFMLGWLIKTAVMKLGGSQKYKSVVVLMTGAIAGDILGGLIFMAHGAIYWSLTGLRPKSYLIFPI